MQTGGRLHLQVNFWLGSRSVHQQHVLEPLEDLTPMSPWTGSAMLRPGEEMSRAPPTDQTAHRREHQAAPTRSELLHCFKAQEATGK